MTAPTATAESETTASPSGSGRLVALDAFRGLTVAGMILVNNPGSWQAVYAPLKHARWHGWTPTDLVFPWFLFAVGVAIPLALGKRVARGDSPAALLGKVARRSAIIFAIGLALNAFPFDKPVSDLRIPGVLQRIAVCYFVTALVYLKTGVRTQVALTVGLLLGYWALMTQISVPGFGAGDLSRQGNLAAWVDRGLLPGHLYQPDYDPEGVLSTLPAVATTLIGVLAGRWLATTRPIGRRMLGLIGAGEVLIILGVAWGDAFPINKALWTSSFVALTAGLALLAFGLCVWLIDVRGYRLWSLPFLAFGGNAIAAYVLSALGSRVLPMIRVNTGEPGGVGIIDLREYLSGHVCGLLAGHHHQALASLLFALGYVGFWLLVMAVFYRRGWFIRV